MKAPTRQKLAAYKRHWSNVRGIQDEFSKQYIHQRLRIANVVTDSQLSSSTVQRFFHFGKGNGYKNYSLFHGPAITTILGIADALGLEIKLQPKKKTNARGGT